MWSCSSGYKCKLLTFVIEIIDLKSLFKCYLQLKTIRKINISVLTQTVFVSAYILTQQSILPEMHEWIVICIKKEDIIICILIFLISRVFKKDWVENIWFFVYFHFTRHFLGRLDDKINRVLRKQWRLLSCKIFFFQTER